MLGNFIIFFSFFQMVENLQEQHPEQGEVIHFNVFSKC
jgi:hypothetical protein